MKKKQFEQQDKWDRAVEKEKNYVMYKRGYKNMLKDIASAKTNIQKFKRGLSIFEDEKIKEHLTHETAAPVVMDRTLSQHFQKVIFSPVNLQKGPLKSIVNNASEEDCFEEISFYAGLDGGASST